MSLMIHPPEETLDEEIKSLTTIRERFLEFVRLRDEVERMAIDFLQSSPRTSELIEVITGEVCHKMVVTREQIHSRQRTDRIATARHLVWWIARDISRSSLVTIGRMFNRDHASVLHGCRKIANRIETEPAFAAVVRETKQNAIERIKRP